ERVEQVSALGAHLLRRGRRSADLHEADRALLRRRADRPGDRAAVPAGRLGGRGGSAALLPRAVLGRAHHVLAAARAPPAAHAARAVRHRPGRARRLADPHAGRRGLPRPPARPGRHTVGVPGDGGAQHAEPLPGRGRRRPLPL
ncbi:MAG: Hemoglobin-like protein HbO, partial [uncultured Blastococcus sp.]